MKNLLNKSTDGLYSTLLAHRGTPLENRYGPAEIAYEQEITVRTVIPKIQKQLSCSPVKSAVKESRSGNDKTTLITITELNNSYHLVNMYTFLITLQMGQ